MRFRIPEVLTLRFDNSLGQLSHLVLFGALATFVIAALTGPIVGEEAKKSEPTAAEKAAEKKKADEEAEAAKKKADAIEELKKDPATAIYDLQQSSGGIGVGHQKGDIAWMLISTALVMLMVPGLALFYCGMVRRKNVLATMMHSMVALAIVGVYWFGIGYALAFGDPWIKLGDKGSILGFTKGLMFLQDVGPQTFLPNTNIPVTLHMLFQGMFAIITPALISGALAERIRFLPYCVFTIIWITFVYCPLAHCVWAMDWNWFNTLLPAAQQSAEIMATSGKNMVGYLGKDSIDFAGGTVVHIAAGFSSLAAILVLRKRLGYPEHAIHPNSMVLTLMGAGILWFGWFGFNGGSALGSGDLAVSAFAATQLAAAGAGLTWTLVEWIHRGKPTALGLASGIVAGLVAVTPASGFIYPYAGLIIGLIAGVVCYCSVYMKGILKYDDSLDAFGVHGVGGFLGAVLTGFFCSKTINGVGFNGLWPGPGQESDPSQIGKQFFAAAVSAVVAFVLSVVIIKLVDILLGGFVTDERSEIDGLDRTEHGETGFDFNFAPEALVEGASAPRAAAVPPDGKRFQVVIDGVSPEKIAEAWSQLCQPNQTSKGFKDVYSYVTTMRGNRFQFRGGDQNSMRDNLQKLLQETLKSPVKAHVEAS